MRQNSNVKLPVSLQLESQVQQYSLLQKTIIVPIFCACLIAAIGSARGLRHITTMQFDVDRNTEFILFNYAVLIIIGKNSDK